jgi:hypothetical protein
MIRGLWKSIAHKTPTENWILKTEN